MSSKSRPHINKTVHGQNADERYGWESRVTTTPDLPDSVAEALEILESVGIVTGKQRHL